MLTRFGLQSTQTGLISSAYDIGSLVVMIPVSYYGGRPGASKPRTVTLPPHRVLISATSFRHSLCYINLQQVCHPCRHGPDQF